MDGIEATRRLPAARSPRPVLMLTTFDMDQYVYEALQAGRAGSCSRTSAGAAGRRDPGRALRGVPARAHRDPAPDPVLPRPPGSDPAAARRLAALTPRELEVLRLVARGLTNVEIAAELFVSETTVKTHVGRVLMKLALRDRVQAVIFAYQHNLARPRAADPKAHR